MSYISSLLFHNRFKHTFWRWSDTDESGVSASSSGCASCISPNWSAARSDGGTLLRHCHRTGCERMECSLPKVFCPPHSRWQRMGREKHSTPHSHIGGALFKDSAASRGGRDVSSRSSASSLCGSDRWHHTHSPNSQSGRALRLASHMAYTSHTVYSQRHASEELRCIDRMDRHYSWHAGRKACVREAIAGDG